MSAGDPESQRGYEILQGRRIKELMDFLDVIYGRVFLTGDWRGGNYPAEADQQDDIYNFFAQDDIDKFFAWEKGDTRSSLAGALQTFIDEASPLVDAKSPNSSSTRFLHEATRATFLQMAENLLKVITAAKKKPDLILHVLEIFEKRMGNFRGYDVKRLDAARLNDAQRAKERGIVGKFDPIEPTDKAKNLKDTDNWYGRREDNQETMRANVALREIRDALAALASHIPNI